MPIGVEMDSLALGKSARFFIDRLTRQRNGPEYDADVKLLYAMVSGRARGVLLASHG